MKKIFPVLLLTLVNTLGFSLLIPVLPFMLRNWGMPDMMFGIMLSMYSLCQFWAAPLFGQLSDQYGRRKLLIWSQAGTLLSWLALILLWFIESQFQIYAFWLVLFLALGRVIDGITGGNNSVTQAYLSDVTTKEQKASYFGYLSAVMGLGMIIGPAIGAYTMATPINYLATALFGVGLSLITLLSIIFALPESLTTFSAKQAMDWLKPFKLKTAFAALKDQQIVRNMMVLQIFLAAAMGAYTSIMIFYLMDQFSLNESQIGNFLFFVGGFAIFNQLFMIKLVVKFWGEARALAFGITLLSLGLMTFPYLSELWQLICLYYLCNLGFSITLPTMKAVVSNEAKDTDQGRLLGFLESINALMFGIMPLVSTAVYGYIKADSFLIWGLLGVAGLFYLVTSMPTCFIKK